MSSGLAVLLAGCGCGCRRPPLAALPRVIGLKSAPLSPLTRWCWPFPASSAQLVVDRECWSSCEARSLDERVALTPKHETIHWSSVSRPATMRRKSRILLCFAVLWILGIAYYFYSGTTLHRKVGWGFTALLMMNTGMYKRTPGSTRLGLFCSCFAFGFRVKTLPPRRCESR